MFNRKPIPYLMDDSCFMTLEQFNSKEVKEKINDLEQHQKTVRGMLSHTLKQKMKEKRPTK